jgi:hypothetical protein
VSVFCSTIFCSNQSVILRKTRLEEYESYIDLTIQIFQSQNPQLLYFLKDFLTCLPSPSYIEQVLIVAMNKLSSIDLEACHWLVSNYSFLMPELDLIDLAKACSQKKLETYGAILHRDFKFRNGNQLYVNKKAKEILTKIEGETILTKNISSKKELIKVELLIQNSLSQLLTEKLLLVLEV